MLQWQSRAAAEARASIAVGFNPLLLVSSASIPWDWEETQMSSAETVGMGNMKHCTMDAGLVCKARCCLCSCSGPEASHSTGIAAGVNDDSAPSRLSKQGLNLAQDEPYTYLQGSCILCSSFSSCASWKQE